MAQAKIPDTERTKKRVLADYKKGKKPKELSEKYGVNVNTIKSWIRRADKPDEKKAGAKKREKRVQPDAPKKSRGAPVENTNSVGHPGGRAPVGNANALIHGGYSPVYLDTLTDDERAFVTGEKLDPEALLQEEILLLSIRERRIMQRIRTFTAIAESDNAQVTASLMRTEVLREFIGANAEDERAEYERVQAEKVADGDALPGHGYSLTTRTESAYDIVQRLEEALTRCQSQKRQCIQHLAELRRESDETLDIEDLDSVEEAIYGGQETPDNPV